MKRIVVLSGKGGTGKTCVTAALAHLASRQRRIVLADADVDASNLELVTGAEIRERHDFTGGDVAVVDPERCDGCGDCLAACRFDAILPGGRINIDEASCEGCAACVHRCPVGALSMHPRRTGEWFVSDSRFGPLYHARLEPGRENSGKLVTAVRRAAEERAERDGAEWLMVDGPPGIGCPVIAASTGCDLAVLVTEPSVSGEHDLDRALSTVSYFGIPAVVVVNKATLSRRWTERLVAHCESLGVPVAACLDFDRAVPRAMLAGRAVTEVENGEVTESLARLLEEISRALAPHAEEVSDGR